MLLQVFSLVLLVIFLAYFALYVLVSSTFNLLHLTGRTSLSLLSEIVVYRRPRYRAGPEELGCKGKCKRRFESKLCGTCNEMVNSSPLLSGTHGLLCRPYEEHTHHDWDELKRRGNDNSNGEEHRGCALCSLLLKSVRCGQANAQNEGDLELGPQKLRVKIWQKSFRLDKPLIRIQLLGPGLESRPLAVGEVLKGVPRVRNSYCNAHGGFQVRRIMNAMKQKTLNLLLYGAGLDTKSINVKATKTPHCSPLPPPKRSFVRHDSSMLERMTQAFA